MELPHHPPNLRWGDGAATALGLDRGNDLIGGYG
jgi:hypothetical protein